MPGSRQAGTGSRAGMPRGYGRRRCGGRVRFFLNQTKEMSPIYRLQQNQQLSKVYQLIDLFVYYCLKAFFSHAID
jgi:hypothetical protein